MANVCDTPILKNDKVGIYQWPYQSKQRLVILLNESYNTVQLF